LLTMGCEAAPNPTTSVLPDTPHPPVLLPLRARSRASCAPTASGQNQRHESQRESLLPGRRTQPQRKSALAWNAYTTSREIRFCPEGVHNLTANLLLPGGRTQPQRKSASARRAYTTSTQIRFCPEGVHNLNAKPLLPGGRRSLACRRWAAKRPPIRLLLFYLTPRIHRFYCRCAPDREQAALLRPPARINRANVSANRFCLEGVHNLNANPLLPGGRTQPHGKSASARPYGSASSAIKLSTS
jgi:hypothetical protein